MVDGWSGLFLVLNWERGFWGDVCGGRSWKLELVLRVGGGAKSVGRPVLLSSVRS